MNNSRFVGAIFLIATSVSAAATKPDSPQAQSDNKCSTVLGRQQAPEFCSQRDRQQSTSAGVRTVNTSLAGKGVPSAPQFSLSKPTDGDLKSSQQGGPK